MSARRLLFFAASIAVSVASLALILRAVPFSDVLNSLSRTDPVYLLLVCLRRRAVFVNARSPLVDLAEPSHFTVLESFHMINVMFLGNQLPFRLGEVARGVLATRRGVPLVTSGTSIIVERLIDVLMLVLLIAVTVSRMPAAPPISPTKRRLFGLLALVGFLILLSLRLRARYGASASEQSCCAPLSRCNAFR